MPVNKSTSPEFTREIWKGFWLIFIPLFGVALALVAAFYQARTSATREILVNAEREKIRLQQKSITTDIDEIISDLRFFASNPHLIELTTKNSENKRALLAELEQDYLLFSRIKKKYDQIRFLDKNGMEVLRVNYNGGQSEIVPQEKLQNKGSRYYFKESFALSKNELFISPLDLNVEHGQIELPLKPMLRIGTPIFTPDGEKKGIILLNYFGTLLLDKLHDWDIRYVGETSLLNRSGYYLHNSDKSKEWGFMFPREGARETFKVDHPKAWDELLRSENGQFENQQGLFTFATAYPLALSSQEGIPAEWAESYSIGQDSYAYFWKLVTFVPHDVLSSQNIALRKVLGSFLLAFALLTAIGAWKISMGRALRAEAQTRRDRLLAEVKETHAQLEEAHQNLKTSQSQLLQQEKMASVGQLAAGVAHEINNPMGFISGNLRSLKKYLERLATFIEAQKTALQKENSAEIEELKALEKKLKINYLLEDSLELIEESLDGADRVQTIVKNLKTFSRVDQNEAQKIDLHECIDSTINIVWNELKYKVEIKKDYGELPQIVCLPQQLSQVFMNLLINASHAISNKGTIEIRTKSHQDHVHVEISDDGCGIAVENLKRIFEPFFTTKEVGKGTGLGLSMVYDIINTHQGSIFVSSEPGQGTTFSIKLPVSNEPLQHTEEERAVS